MAQQFIVWLLGKGYDLRSATFWFYSSGQGTYLPRTLVFSSTQ